jgi:ubiquitin-like 1-activating enzyme E1 B
MRIQVFQDDIARLLTMSDMWRFRAPPVPLDRNSILEQGPVNSPFESHLLRDQRALTLRDNVHLFDTRYVAVENGRFIC